MPRIVLIDDDDATLERLTIELTSNIPAEAVVKPWQPESGREMDQLNELLDDTVLVVTDLDLSIAKSGIGGDSVLRWCQRQAVPCALYTRRVTDESAVPDLFELRLPRGQPHAPYIAQVYTGFKKISDAISGLPEQIKTGSLAAILADLLGRPELEYQFAEYATHLGEASGALTGRVQQTASDDALPSAPSDGEIKRLLGYVLGHLLLNAIIRYPGPLLPMAGLCGYIGTTDSESETLADIFATAAYDGPFSGVDRIFWRQDVDSILETLLSDNIDGDRHSIRRRIVERKIGRDLERHTCDRCGGVNGGFYCPFTKRPVCERGDCSTGSNTWLPLGASACRVEMDFFDEWAPLLRF